MRSAAHALPHTQRNRLVSQATELREIVDAAKPDRERVRSLLDELLEGLRAAQPQPELQLTIMLGHHAQHTLSTHER